MDQNFPEDSSPRIPFTCAPAGSVRFYTNPQHLLSEYEYIFTIKVLPCRGAARYGVLPGCGGR
jgi:hypothetical protein